MPVIWWFEPGLELGGAEAVDVADEEDGCGGGARAARFEALDDGVHDHDILARIFAQADGFARPDLFAAEVDAVVDAFAGRDGVVGELVEQGEGVVDGFGGEDAAVDFGVALAVTSGADALPVDVIVGEPGGGETVMGGEWWRPSQPRTEAVFGFDDLGRRVMEGVRDRLDEVSRPVVVMHITGQCTFKNNGETPSVASVKPDELSGTENVLVVLGILVLFEALCWRKLSGDELLGSRLPGYCGWNSCSGGWQF